MTSVAIASVSGAPGVSTLVAAAAATSTHDRPLLVVEAAPAGGVVAARWGWPRRSTIAELAMDLSDTVDLWAAARPWLSGSRIVLADPSAVVMRQATPGRWLAERLHTVAQQTLVDAGRIDGTADQLDLLAAAGQVWLLVDPTVDQVTAVRAAAGWLNRTGPVSLLVREQATGPGRYAGRQVADTLGWPLAATVPHDPRAAAALCGLTPATRGLRHAPLLRTAVDLLSRVQEPV